MDGVDDPWGYACDMTALCRRAFAFRQFAPLFLNNLKRMNRMRARMYKSAKVAFLALAISLAANAASAQNAAVVAKERQEIMKGLFPLLRGASQVARGESTDVAAIPAKAQEAVAALQKFATLFPAGSGREGTPDTRATPAIWSEKAAFDAAVAKLAAETQKLGDVAKTGGVDAVKTQWTAVSEACGGCHGGPSRSGGKFRFEAPQ